MTSLVDLGALKEEVTVRGTKLNVSGISAENILNLLVEIPELRLVFAGKEIEDPLTVLTQRGGRGLAAVLVMGLGLWSDDKETREKEISAARGLTAGEQTDLLRAIFRLTFPQGITSFMEGLTSVMGSAVGKPTKEAATR